MNLSPSKQGCFKCGEMGHLAEGCPSPGALCYNCKSPDHRSTACPLPRSTDAKQCYLCGQKGHIKATCPNLHGYHGPQFAAISAGAAIGPPGAACCFNCGRQGHIARHCPLTYPSSSHLIHPSLGNGQQHPGRVFGFGPTQKAIKCYGCGGDNHLARDCLAGATIGSYGTASPSIPIVARQCYRCQGSGHIARDCAMLNDAE